MGRERLRGWEGVGERGYERTCESVWYVKGVLFPAHLFSHVQTDDCQ